jgi:hypothetical protein
VFGPSHSVAQRQTAGQISEATVPEDEQMRVISGTFSARISGPDADQLMQQKAARRTENKTGIPDEVKARMESAFNTDFSGVRVHPNSPAAPAVGALAYTQGTDIHFAPGQFSPNTSPGQRLLGHELAHVQQQSHGRVRPTTEVNGLPVNDSPALEEEADRLGGKAIK